MKSTSAVGFALIAIASMTVAMSSKAALPSDYKGKPFQDEVHATGPLPIPGRVECAYYDLGGEGVAYHDTDTTNHGSGELRSEEHTSELQSQLTISYAVFCLKKKK